MKKFFLMFAIIVGCFLYFSCFLVKETEFVILTQFGKAVKIIKDSGLYYRMPFAFQKINRIEKRIISFTTQPIQLLMGDKNPIIITCYVCFKVKDPLLYFQSLIYEDIAIQKISDMVISQLGSTLSDYRMDQMINVDSSRVKIEEIEALITRGTNKKTLEKYGIEMMEVGIRRMNYPAIVADSVYERMKSEREKEAKKFRAEGAEEASKIYAQTEKEAMKLKSEAYRKSEIIKGVGDRKSIKIYADAYGKNPELFEFLKSMDTLKEVLKDKGTLIFSTDSELFRYLNYQSPKKEGK